MAKTELKERGRGKRVAAVLAALLILAVSVFPVNALPLVSGETDGYTEEVFDGVYHTLFSTEGTPYGKQKVHVVEFDLAQRNLDVEILKGQYLVSKKTVKNYVKTYNAENKAEGRQVISAVNGDLWMTGVHSGPKVSKKILMVPRGILIEDGVLHCSSQVPNESRETTNGEGHAYTWAFGITEDYVPIIGQPIISFSVNNSTQGKTVSTDAFNRLPAIDTLVIYNGNCNIDNYALDDAYEVVLTGLTGEFKFGSEVGGTVSAIYGPEDDTSPALTMDSLVLTARGTAISDIKDYKVGDKISINMSVTDISGRDNDWTKVVTAIGGHMPMVLDGVSTGLTEATRYPATIVGIKNDGKVVFVQNDGRQATWSQGMSISQMDDLMLQLGVNTAINLDGGGSSTMVVGEELVNKPSDPGNAERAVINGIALVSCPERAAQGEFTPSLPYRFDARYIKFDGNDSIKPFLGGNNQTAVSYEDGYARFRPAAGSNDPYSYCNVSSAYNSLSASQYKYIVMKYRTSEKVTTPQTELFLCAGSIAGPTGGYSIMFNQGKAGEWNTQIVDLSALPYWTGSIHGVRLDYFAGNANDDEYFDLEYLAFAKTKEEAQAYADGTASIPEAPAEDASIKAAVTGSYKVLDGILWGVKNGSTTYDVVNGVSGPKLEIYDAEGNNVRSGLVRTGYTICSYDSRLNKAHSLTIAVMGDPNADGLTDNLDALQILLNEAKLLSFDDVQLAAADLNGDGVVDNADAAIVLRMDVGLTD